MPSVKSSSKTGPSHRKLVLCFQKWNRSSRTAQLSPWCALQIKYSLLASALTLLPLSFCPGNNFFRGVLFPHWPQVIHPQGLLRAFPEEPGGHRLQSGEHSRICGVCDTSRTQGYQGRAPQRAHRHWHQPCSRLSCPTINMSVQEQQFCFESLGYLLSAQWGVASQP